MSDGSAPGLTAVDDPRRGVRPTSRPSGRSTTPHSAVRSRAVSSRTSAGPTAGSTVGRSSRRPTTRRSSVTCSSARATSLDDDGRARAPDLDDRTRRGRAGPPAAGVGTALMHAAIAFATTRGQPSARPARARRLLPAVRLRAGPGDRHRGPRPWTRRQLAGPPAAGLGCVDPGRGVVSAGVPRGLTGRPAAVGQVTPAYRRP